MNTTPDKILEFEKLARPLIQYLNENHNPHSVIIITCDNAQVLSGELSTGEILDYIKD